MNTQASSLYSLYLFLLLAAYCVFEYLFIPYGALSTDEFVFAKHLLEYTHHLPYKDFPPYKTVLGHYLISLPLFFSQGLLAPLFHIKLEIAAINLVLLWVTAKWANQLFDKKTVFMTLLAIMANQLFLIYSTELRVDMLTAWCCLFSIFAVLDKRFALGGFLLGLAFLISQKALWYWLAINGAMSICWLCFNHQYQLKAIFQFNAYFILSLVAYIIFWSALANPEIVLNSLFYEAYIQAGIDWYQPLYLTCWSVLLHHGALLFLLWPFTFIILFLKPENEKSLFIVSLASIALILFIRYKQPFPYNFVFTIPAFFILYAEFLTYLFNPSKDILKTTSTKSIRLLAIYAILIIAIIILFALPAINYLALLLIPALANYFCAWSSPYYQRLSYYLALSIGLILGFLFPLYESLKVSYLLDGTYQKTMIRLSNELLKDNTAYISGIPFLYAKDQPIPGMENLIGPAIDYLYQANPKLAPLLLPSLYLSETNSQKIMADFERAPVKLIINNYRLLSLPPILSQYIEQHYQHYYGSLYLYSPLIDKKQLSIDIKFSGQYKVMAAKQAQIKIDGKAIKSQQIIHLKQGWHLSHANRSYRLQLQTDQQRPEGYQKDEWHKMIKAIVV